MKACNFTCPNCSAQLRVRDRSFVGRQIQCPDCQTQISIVSAGRDSVAAEISQGATTEGAENFMKSSGVLLLERLSSENLKSRFHFLTTPVGISWTVAGTFALLLVIAVRPFGSASSEDDAVSPQTAVAESTEGRVAKAEPVSELTAEVIDAQDVATNDVPQPVTAVEPDRKPMPLANQDEQPIEVTFAPEFVLPPPFPAGQPIVAERNDKIAAAENLPDEGNVPNGVAKVVARPEPNVIDVKSALSQPILRFEQPTEVPFGKLLRQFEEMAGVPVHFQQNEQTKPDLERPITLTLGKSTLGELLENLLSQVEWTSAVEASGLRVFPVDSKPNDIDRKP